jgi:ATP-dependent DNA ligase
MNPEAWTLIFSCSNLAEAELMKGLLIDNDIEAVVINKKDSVYLIGDAELYVKASDALIALQLLNINKP